MAIIDLTRLIPNDAGLTLASSKFHSGGPLDHYRITRIEAPRCLVKGGNAICDFDAQVFVRTAVLLDFTHKKSDEAIDDEDFEGAEERAGLALREGEIAIIRTGVDVLDESDVHLPAGPVLSKNAAEYLEFKHVAGVASNISCIENPADSALPVHSILMKNNVLIIEDLCNLDKIRQDRFQLIALPLKVMEAVSPARVVALVEDTA